LGGLLVTQDSAWAHLTSDQGQIYLARDGRAQVVIIFNSGEASESERTAVNELRSYLGKITGADFRVVAEGSAGDGASAIYLGRTRFAELHDIDSGQLGGEESIIRTVGRNLVLTGGRPRGTLYAVYMFLEDVLGCRWYTPWVERVPRIPQCAIPNLDLRKRPALDYRDVYTMLNSRSVLSDQESLKWFAVRNRLNGPSSGFGVWWRDLGNHSHVGLNSGTGVGGGWLSAGPGSHSFAWFFPVDRYFRDHPEYFSMRNGVRVPSTGADGNQLCLTNPDVLRLMTDKVRAEFRRLPDAQYISVSQNDGGTSSLCDCPRCRAAAAVLGESGLLLQFVNAVAEGIRDEFPDKLVVTLSYIATADPPRTPISAESNVVVWVCSAFHSGSVNAPLAGHYDNLVNWAKHASRIWLWDYMRSDEFPMDFSAPLLWKLDEQFKLARTLPEVQGVFEEDEVVAEMPLLPEMYELRWWIAAKFMEDPSRDLTKTYADFLAGYYGPAAPELSKYLSRLAKEVSRWPFAMMDFGYIRFVQSCFDRALRVVKDNPALRSRVEEWRLDTDLSTLTFRHQLLRDFIRRGYTKANYPFRAESLLRRLWKNLGNTTSPLLRSTPPEYDLGAMVSTRRSISDQTLRYVSMLARGKDAVALPDKLKEIGPRNLIEVTAPQLAAGGAELVEDEQSTLGLALALRGRGELPFPVGVLDRDRRAEQHSLLSASQVPGGGYYLYHFGPFPLPRRGFVYLSNRQSIQVRTYPFHQANRDDARWDIWVSIRFDGPAYPHGNPQNEDRVLVDRLYLAQSVGVRR
jgi:hypothetical protein